MNELRKAQARADRAEQRIRKVTDLLGLEPNESPEPTIKLLIREANAWRKIRELLDSHGTESFEKTLELVRALHANNIERLREKHE